MALEDLLKELIETMKETNEVTKTLVSLRTEAIESVKSAAAPKTTKAAKEAEPAPKAAKEPATKDTKVYEELKDLIAEYVGGSSREDERAARKAKVRKLLQHEAIKKPGTPDDVFDTVNIKDDAIDIFKANLTALIAKGDITSDDLIV